MKRASLHRSLSVNRSRTNSALPIRRISKARSENKHREQTQVAPCKGIQESLGFWIPHCGFRIPGTGFRIPAQWIPDSQKGWIPNFFVCVLMLFFAFPFRV